MVALLGVRARERPCHAPASQLRAMNRHHLRGQTLLRQKRFAEAVDALRLARLEDPDDPLPAVDLALALVQTDRGHEASALATELIGLAPDLAFPHYILGLVELNRSHPKEGEAALRRALAIDPEDADIHGLLARAHLEQNRPGEALASADAGLAIDPANDNCLTFRSHALLVLGRHEEASAVNRRLLELDPTDPHSHALRGEELLRAGRPAEALPHFREALRIDPKHEGARYHLALCIKARSPLFGAVLRFIVRLETLNVWALAGTALAIFVALNFAIKSLQADPVWPIVLTAVKLGLLTFCILAAVANQLYDLLLWGDPEGRLALSPAEIRAARWNLACFLLAALFFALGSMAKNPSKLYQMALSFLMLTRLISETFDATPGWVRKRLGWLSVISAACIFAAPIFLFVVLFQALRAGDTGWVSLAFKGSLFIGLVPVIAGGFADDIRLWLERRRRDAT